MQVPDSQNPEDWRDKQKLFEPDIEIENEKGPLGRWVRFVVAGIAIVGLLYLSGVYQGFLFRRTPATTEYPEVASQLDAETITLPLQVFVLTGGKDLGSRRTSSDVNQMVTNASAIWAQADISLVVEELRFLELTDEERGAFLVSHRDVITNIDGYNPARINVFLTRTLSGINGVAFGGLRSTAVADFTTVNDFRTFAHEIGHILGLGHTGDTSRLMSQGSNGTVLTLDEVTNARREAYGLKEAN